MQEYKQIILGEVALYYVKKHLSHGLTLTKYVRVNVDLDAGQVIVGFPENANLKEINNFESGGFLPTAPEEDWVHLGRDGKKSTMVPVSLDLLYVTDTINAFLADGEGKICVFENRNAKPEYPWLKSCQSHIWVSKNEVYHVLSKELLFANAIERTILEARSLWTFVGYLTSFPDAKQNFPKSEVTDELLLILAKRVEKIIVGAYDGEGFLIWHKTQ